MKTAPNLNCDEVIVLAFDTLSPTIFADGPAPNGEGASQSAKIWGISISNSPTITW